MPLDPSIFMNSAAMYSQGQSNLLNALQGYVNKYVDSKRQDELLKMEKEKIAAQQNSPEAMAKRLDALGEIEFNKAVNGEPYEKSLANIFVAKQQKYGFNPTTQAPMALPNSFERLLNTGRSPANVESVTSTELPSPSGILIDGNAPIPQVSASELQPSVYDTLRRAGASSDRAAPPETPQSLYRTLAGSIQQPATPAGNPAATQTAIDETTKAKVALQKKAAESAIETQAAKEKKTAENEADASLRDKGLNSLLTNIDKLILDSEGTPSSFIEGVAATATSLAGKPNNQAKAAAKFGSGKAIAGLQSRIAFLKGQGTVTDSEAKEAMAFMPKPDDPIEIKKTKLEAAKTYIGGLMSKNNNAQAQPENKSGGVKFLGYE